MKTVTTRTFLAAAGLLLSLAPVLPAQQTLHLKDGRSLEGIMAARNDQAVNWMLAEGEGSAAIPLDQIDYIEFPEPPVWTQSMEAFEAGDFKKAAAGFKQIVDQRKAPWTYYPAPGNFAALAQVRLLDCHRRLRDWKSLGDLAGTVEWDQLPIEERRAEPVMAVWSAIAAKDYEKAAGLAEEAVGKVPELVGQLGLARSVMYREQDEPEKAAIALSEVFGTFPGRDREASAAAMIEAAVLFRQFPERLTELKALVHTYAGLFGEGKLWEGADPAMGKLLAESLDVTELKVLGGAAEKREGIQVANGSFENPAVEEDFTEGVPHGWKALAEGGSHLRRADNEGFKSFSAQGSQLITLKENRGICQKIGAGAVEPFLAVEVRFSQYQQTNIDGKGGGVKVELWSGEPDAGSSVKLSDEIFPATGVGEQAERVTTLRCWSGAAGGGELFLALRNTQNPGTKNSDNVAIDRVTVTAEIPAHGDGAGVAADAGQTVFERDFSGKKEDEAKNREWSGSKDWRADGACQSKEIANLWRGFSPEPGKVYRLSAAVRVIKGDPSAWFGLGFAKTNDEKSAIWSNEPGPWMMLRTQDEAGVPEGGRAICGRQLGPSFGFAPEALKSPDYKEPAQVEVVLDTRPDRWEAEWFVDGKSVTGLPVPLSGNPDLKFAGIGVYKGAEVKVSGVKLTVSGE